MEFVGDKDTFTILYDIPDRIDWIRQALKDYGKVTISKAFTIKKNMSLKDLMNPMSS